MLLRICQLLIVNSYSYCIDLDPTKGIGDLVLPARVVFYCSHEFGDDQEGCCNTKVVSRRVSACCSSCSMGFVPVFMSMAWTSAESQQSHSSLVMLISFRLPSASFPRRDTRFINSSQAAEKDLSPSGREVKSSVHWHEQPRGGRTSRGASPLATHTR